MNIHTNLSFAGTTADPNEMSAPGLRASQNANTPLTPSLVTVVTAFFDIGKFGKGAPANTRTPATYLNWAQTFKLLLNPLVVYTDSKQFYDYMLKLREKFQTRTKMFMLNRTSSWAFQRKDITKDIFSIKGYPKHYPNTVVPEYSCAMHAKYDVITRAATSNYFHTDYFMWLDVGLFRAEVKSEKYFSLELPQDFNDSRIAVNQVYNVSMSEEISVIIKQKLDWICGCIFLGRRDVILKYAEQYKRAVDYFLSQKLMNTDQQVLYAMYSKSGRTHIKPEIELQLYKNGHNPWFYLGYLMRKVVERVNSTVV